MHNGLWSALQPGDRVEAFSGEPIGAIVEVAETSITVLDPVENRELLIPRDVCEGRPGGGGIRLREHPIHSAGTGPERFVRRSNIADDWVAEQISDPQRTVMVESASPTEGRRVTDDGMAMVPDDADLAETLEDEGPTEVWNGAMRGALNQPPPPNRGLHPRTPSVESAEKTARAKRKSKSDRMTTMKLNWSATEKQSLLHHAVKVVAKVLGVRGMELWALMGLVRMARKFDEHLTRGHRERRAHMS